MPRAGAYLGDKGAPVQVPGENTLEATAPVIEYRTRGQAVTHFLRSAILSGRLGPGDRVAQEEIAKQLNVSGIPVREALRALQSEGLVEIRPHRGAVVVSLRPQDIMEVFDIRATLEARAVELAAPQLTDAALVRLRQIWEEMDRLLTAWNHERWLALNREFHSTICRASGRPRLCALIDAQANALLPYQRAASGLIARKRPGHEEHYRILLAAEARDAQLLASRAAEHLRGTARDLMDYFSTHRSETDGQVDTQGAENLAP
jgi:DNA-binding GntR family transcriptional regulator